MKITVALSGGVDSGVAAWLLKEQGHDVSGLFMRHTYCKSNDEADARSVAESLHMDYDVFDADAVFATIIDSFVSDYLSGKTPNPCVLCNRTIKFGALLNAALESGAEGFATGHYAILDRSIPCIRPSADFLKDQTYVLFGIDKERLPLIHFPLGEFTKDEVRKCASKIGIPVSAKKESQEICFVPDHKHPEFIRQHPFIGKYGDTSGNFVDSSGRILAPHDGYERFTIGQRKGFRIGFGERKYISQIDPVTKNIVLGSESDLKKQSLNAAEANWQHPVPFDAPFQCEAKIRYRSPAKAAVLHAKADGTFTLNFQEPVFAVTPGQYAVCYKSDLLLGGGKIIS